MTHFSEEAIGMAGFLTNLAGNLLLTKKNKHGWWIRIVSNMLWTVYAGTTASFSVNINHVVFFFLNIYGWYNWSKNRNADVAPE